MDEDNLLPFSLPAVCRKKVSVAFDGGLLSSDGGVMLLRDVERRVGLAERLAGCLTDRRDPARTDHELIEMLRLRMFLIAAGYEEYDQRDTLRRRPMVHLALGRRLWWSCSARVGARRRPRSRSTSTTRSTGSMDTSNSRSSMHIMTSAASYRSTYTRPVPASRSPSSCAKARRRAGPKSVPSSGT